MPATNTVFAWCFSHGALHRFPAGKAPFCDATWVPLAGKTETAALETKTATYGEARFIDDLPAEQQVTLILGAKEV